MYAELQGGHRLGASAPCRRGFSKEDRSPNKYLQGGVPSVIRKGPVLSPKEIAYRILPPGGKGGVSRLVEEGKRRLFVDRTITEAKGLLPVRKNLSHEKGGPRNLNKKKQNRGLPSRSKSQSPKKKRIRGKKREKDGLLPRKQT